MGTDRLPKVMALLALVLGAGAPACGRSSMGALHDGEGGICSGHVERGYLVDAYACAQSSPPRLPDYQSSQGLSCGLDLALADSPTTSLCNDLPPKTSRCLLEVVGFPEAFSRSQLPVSMKGALQNLTVCRGSWKGSKEVNGGEDCAAEAVFVPCEAQKIAE